MPVDSRCHSSPRTMPVRRCSSLPLKTRRLSWFQGHKRDPLKGTGEHHAVPGQTAQWLLCRLRREPSRPSGDPGTRSATRPAASATVTLFSRCRARTQVRPMIAPLGRLENSFGCGPKWSCSQGPSSVQVTRYDFGQPSSRPPLR
jgi:hypothetical protein